MFCPVCKTVELKMSDRHGVEIDYCPQCRGVWLDRGELDKIIERSVPAQAAPQPSQVSMSQRDYDDRHRHESEYPKKKKRGSFLEELFDF